MVSQIEKALAKAKVEKEAAKKTEEILSCRPRIKGNQVFPSFFRLPTLDKSQVYSSVPYPQIGGGGSFGEASARLFLSQSSDARLRTRGWTRL